MRPQSDWDYKNAIVDEEGNVTSLNQDGITLGEWENENVIQTDN